MPLSEHEQRLLSEMEQRLLQEDPRFASAMRHHATGGQPKRKLALGVVGVLVGLSAMLVALYNHAVPFAVLGFVIMLASAYWAITAPRKKGPEGVVTTDGNLHPRQSGRRPGQKRGAQKRGSDSFVQRMEQRWERRRETGKPDA